MRISRESRRRATAITRTLCAIALLGAGLTPAPVAAELNETASPPYPEWFEHPSCAFLSDVSNTCIATGRANRDTGRIDGSIRVASPLDGRLEGGRYGSFEAGFVLRPVLTTPARSFDATFEYSVERAALRAERGHGWGYGRVSVIALGDHGACECRAQVVDDLVLDGVEPREVAGLSRRITLSVTDQSGGDIPAGPLVFEIRIFLAVSLAHPMLGLVGDRGFIEGSATLTVDQVRFTSVDA